MRITIIWYNKGLFFEQRDLLPTRWESGRGWMLYCYRMIYYYFQSSEEWDSTLSALIYVCSFCDSIGRSGELYWNVLLYIFLSSMKSILYPSHCQCYELSFYWMDIVYIPLWLKSYSHIYVYVPELKIIPNKLWDPWDQIINREIRVYMFGKV